MRQGGNTTLMHRNELAVPFTHIQQRWETISVANVFRCYHMDTIGIQRSAWLGDDEGGGWAVVPVPSIGK